MPTSTIVILVMWAVLATLALMGLGVFFGFLFGMLIAMFAYPVVMVFKSAFPDLADSYVATFGPEHALTAPLYALLGLGVVLLVVGYMRFGVSGRGIGMLNVGANFGGLATVLLISAGMLDSEGFGN